MQLPLGASFSCTMAARLVRMDDTSYLKKFEDDSPTGEKRRRALQLALDIRKFEIDLYWKCRVFLGILGPNVCGLLRS
jgi:hypothetical protein